MQTLGLIRVSSFPCAGQRSIGSFRHNMCTGDWIAFPGDERMRRPRAASEMGRYVRLTPPTHNQDCPFCPPNNVLLPPSLLELQSRDFGMAKTGLSQLSLAVMPLEEENEKPLCTTLSFAESIATSMGGEESHELRIDKNYKLIVIPNKYPVVVPTHCLVDPETYPTTVLAEADFFCDQMIECLGVAESMGQRRLSATGFHEVLIDYPKHRFTLADSTPIYWEMIFRAWRDRSRILSQSSLIQTVLCFKNHGFFAGASLAHPHAQMIALPIVPSRQEKRQNLAREHYRFHAKCLFCDYIQFELREKSRIVAEAPEFVAVIPFAANIPYHTAVFPKRHNHQFNNATDEDIEALSHIIHDIFSKIHNLLGNTDFNIVIRSAHLYRSRFRVYEPKCFYHWYVEIYPRLASWPIAGFEFGSGILCNSHLPEDDAEALKTGKLKNFNVW